MKMISEDELLDDKILEELQPFITEWTVEANDIITLPIAEGDDYTVDYGDGEGELKVNNQNNQNHVHTYISAGTYTITIKGKFQKCIFGGLDCKEKLTKIVQWGSTGINEIHFKNKDNSCKKYGWIKESLSSYIKELS